VATDIAARGIDVEALGHVVNFDVPTVPDDYIHRVGRTARASATGDAFTFVSRDEAGDLAQIERAVGRKLPVITVAGFDYTARPQAALEVPLQERIAAIRARKAEDRTRARANADRRGDRGTPGSSSTPDSNGRSAGGRGWGNGGSNGGSNGGGGGLGRRAGSRPNSGRRPGSGRSSGSR